MVEIGLLVRRNRTGNNQLQKVVLFRPVLIGLDLKRSPISTSPISFQSYFTDYRDAFYVYCGKTVYGMLFFGSSIPLLLYVGSFSPLIQTNFYFRNRLFRSC
jgi:hypothetical protein